MPARGRDVPHTNARQSLRAVALQSGRTPRRPALPEPNIRAGAGDVMQPPGRGPSLEARLEARLEATLETRLEAWAGNDRLRAQARQQAVAAIRRCCAEKNPRLDLSGLDLGSLPDCLDRIPIRELILVDCQLQSLPPLPPGLTRLNLRQNRLHALPALPDTLSHLLVRSNRIRELPALPDSLINLNVSQNALTSLPPSIGTAPHLTHVNLLHNHIPDAELDAFAGAMKARDKDMATIRFDQPEDWHLVEGLGEWEELHPDELQAS